MRIVDNALETYISLNYLKQIEKLMEEKNDCSTIWMAEPIEGRIKRGGGYGNIRQVKEMKNNYLKMANEKI